MTYRDAFEGRTEIVIGEITTDEGAEIPFDEIDFAPYDNPNISIDTASRFSKKDIIGGTTVRQRIGEDQTDITIEGVCTEEVAIQVDELRKAKLVTLFGDRFARSVRAQVASTSSDPLDDGGAANMDGGEFLYNFTINCVEVTFGQLEDEGTGFGGGGRGPRIQ